MINDWAIVVGIQPYAHQSMNTLSGPEKDAQEFYKWLINEKGGNVPESHVKFFTPANYEAPQEPYDARPNTSDIHACIERITALLEEQKERNRRLYIYMAGHGCTPTQDTGVVEDVALFMANAQHYPSLYARHNFPGTSCAKYMRYGGYFEEVVLIMDCCRSKHNAVSLPFLLEENTVRRGRLILAYATGWDSVANEWPFPPDNEKRGIFTHELVEVLHSGRITAAQLSESVKEHVRRFFKVNPQLRNSSNSQEPEILGKPDDLEAIVFSEDADPPRSLVTIKCQNGMPPPEVLYGGWPPKPVPREPGDPEDKWQWLLTPGIYGLKVGDRYIEKTFTVFAALPEEVEVVL